MSSNREQAFISPPLSESKQIIGEVQEVASIVATGSRGLLDIVTGITVSSLITGRCGPGSGGLTVL